MTRRHTILPELTETEDIIHKLGSYAKVQVELTASHGSVEFPIYSICIGPDHKDVPTIAFVGGVHGLERIGSRVAISFMRFIQESITWDESLHRTLETVRLVFYPIVNPVGMYLRRRSNGNGVDLMRNAPVEAEIKPRLALPAGHRLSPRLPWYRGQKGKPMESEAIALCRFVERELHPSPFTVALDLHSGFGTVDRLWFPYAKTKRPFPGLPQVHALKELIDKTLMHHVYQIEPQSDQYVTHGDLWDYMYDIQRAKYEDRIFIPLCLEMGSWLWVKKNPRQLFTALGVFNPMLPHRRRRTMRRHLPLFDFLLRAGSSFRNWLPRGVDELQHHERAAMKLWYKNQKVDSSDD